MENKELKEGIFVENHDDLIIPMENSKSWEDIIAYAESQIKKKNILPKREFIYNDLLEELKKIEKTNE